jgi:hypothetical protein
VIRQQFSFTIPSSCDTREMAGSTPGWMKQKNGCQRHPECVWSSSIFIRCWSEMIHLKCFWLPLTFSHCPNTPVPSARDTLGRLPTLLVALISFSSSFSPFLTSYSQLTVTISQRKSKSRDQGLTVYLAVYNTVGAALYQCVTPRPSLSFTNL